MFTGAQRGREYDVALFWDSLLRASALRFKHPRWDALSLLE